MRYLIGFGLTILGGVLTAVTGFMPFVIIAFIGVFLFASFPNEAVFFDYRMANSDEVLLRKRFYLNFLPFTIVSHVLTFGNATLKIIWKEEYLKATITSEENITAIKLSRREYISLRNEQRILYSTQSLSKEFMENSYTIVDIGFKRKKTRLIVVSILAAIMLTALTEPGGIFLTLIYEAVFLPMIILWIPEYKDAKILQQAYDKSANTNIPSSK